VTALIVVSLLVVLAAFVALALAAVGRRATRDALAREERRAEALRSLHDRLRTAAASLDLSAPVPAPGDASATRAAPAVAGSRGRAALLDALTDAVAAARLDHTRLAVAHIETREGSAALLAARVAGATGLEPYEVGPRAVALVVRDGGRADALGLLARVEAACGATGDAVELEPGESAVELLARALSARSA
jgi:hypothetical protein